MARLQAARREGRLAATFAGVSLLGFATDAIVLHLGVDAGLAPAWARVISLFCAMQVTFVINGLHVFGGLDIRRPWRPWTAYMLANGLGNFCNYWIFVTLVSTHWTWVSTPLPALAAGAFVAWLINYAGARWIVFRQAPVVLAGYEPPADLPPPA